uniref:Uncharacterized protein LOC114325360 n=1 Tax=Diabrotica virgifera virgifera TaxID=50390 RepID=A0A6P7F1L4_DIAVI
MRRNRRCRQFDSYRNGLEHGMKIITGSYHLPGVPPRATLDPNITFLILTDCLPLTIFGGPLDKGVNHINGIKFHHRNASCHARSQGMKRATTFDSYLLHDSGHQK